jgi:hypothetical protein
MSEFHNESLDMCQIKPNVLHPFARAPQALIGHPLTEHRPDLSPIPEATLASLQGPAAGASASRRRRLWDLNAHAHCPVIGVCLPIHVVRKLVARVRGHAGPELDDYDSHCMAVTEGRRRSPLADLVQKELDQRHALAIREAARIKTDEGLLAWWQTGAQGPRLAQALWVTLTHPCCTPAIEYRVLGQVHMLQHQVGMNCRVEQDQFESLMQENMVLTRHLAMAQERCTSLTMAHGSKVEDLDRRLMHTRAEVLTRDTEIASLQERLSLLQASAPDMPSRIELLRRQGDLITQAQQMRRQLFQAQEEIARLRSSMQAPQGQQEGDDAEGEAPEGRALPTAVLRDRSVLCVGGRAAIVPIYRELVEHEGGRFLHHDGGEEHSAAQLDATLAAADLVICQTGCVSHNAYWRVKDHCKRTGKQCVFVETPSRSALSRALQAMAQAQEHDPHDIVKPVGEP